MTTTNSNSMLRPGLKKTSFQTGFSALLLAGALTVPALAQSATQSNMPAQSSVAPTTATDPAAQTVASNQDQPYATGAPLAGQSKEGFWGHVNPFARKKWVNRQVQPIKDRTNELDQLQAKNANDIKDVDSRATAGIAKANDAAAQADQHAMAAGQRADAANGVATTASTKTDALHGTVSNLDQYQTVTSNTLPFVAGRTSLTPKQKTDLDAFADKLSTEKGYIVEVQGYSRAGVAPSQAMADSVVRYLVTAHNVPVFRIYKSGVGKDTSTPADGQEVVKNGVRITLLHNSLATMDGTSASNATPSTMAPAAEKSQNAGMNQ